MSSIKKTIQYDLEERTGRFGETIILFCKTLSKNIVNDVLIKQIVRAATSVGANYCEANGACSRKDFKNKIFLCKKEVQETKHWIKMLQVAVPEKKEVLQKSWEEAQELTLIFQKILSSLHKSDTENSMKIDT